MTQSATISCLIPVLVFALSGCEVAGRHAGESISPSAERSPSTVAQPLDPDAAIEATVEKHCAANGIDPSEPEAKSVEGLNLVEEAKKLGADPAGEDPGLAATVLTLQTKPASSAESVGE